MNGGQEDEAKRNIYDLGHFEGGMFLFKEPFVMASGDVVRKVDLNHAIIPEDSGLTREDVILALTAPHGITVPASEDDIPPEVRQAVRRIRAADPGGPKADARSVTTKHNKSRNT